MRWPIISRIFLSRNRNSQVLITIRSLAWQKQEPAKDLFIIDTRNMVNQSMSKAFKDKGYTVKVATGFVDLPDEVLREACGFTAIGMCPNRKIAPDQVNKSTMY